MYLIRILSFFGLAQNAKVELRQKMKLHPLEGNV